MKRRSRRSPLISCLRRLPRGVAWTNAVTYRKRFVVEKGGTMYGPYTKTAAQKAVDRCGGRVVHGYPTKTTKKAYGRRGGNVVYPR